MHGKPHQESALELDRGSQAARWLGLVVAGVTGLLPGTSLAQQPPPNILVLLDNSEAMQDFEQPLPEAYTPGFYPPTTPGTPPGDLGSHWLGGHFINTGCTDPALVAEMSWFQKDSPDPSLNGRVTYDLEGLNSKFFDADRFYHARGRRLSWQYAEAPYALFSDFTALDSEASSLNSCYQVVGWREQYFSSPVMDECQRCLATKGWWRGPLVTSMTDSWAGGPFQAPDEPALPVTAFRKWVVKGGVLNLRPPRFVIARKVLKDIIAAKLPVRLGVAAFGVDHGHYDPPEILSQLWPSCSKTFPTFTVDDTDTVQLKTAVNQTRFRRTERPLGEALFGLGGYFSSERRDGRWSSWFSQPVNPGAFGWPGRDGGGTTDHPYTGQSGASWGTESDEWLKPPRIVNGAYLPGQPFEPYAWDGRSVCEPGQANAIIVLTGGQPHGDNTVPITKMMSLLVAQGARHPNGALLTFDPSNPEFNPKPGGVNYCHLSTGTIQEDCDYADYNWPTGLARTNKNFMDDVAFFLSRTDLRKDMRGNQKLRTSIVNMGADSPMLRSIALAGEGLYLRAQQTAPLRGALLDALHHSRTPLP